jgi:hypothetical protein
MKREARMIFDLPEKKEPEELTPLRLQEIAFSEELKKKVKLPVEHKREKLVEKLEKPMVTALVDNLLKDLA